MLSTLTLSRRAAPRGMRGFGMAAAALAASGLFLELSRPASVIGWTLREVHDGLVRPSALHGRFPTLTFDENDIDIMVRTTIGEAALEPDEGKIAVIYVIINRALQDVRWYGGNNVADVALHKATVTRSSGRRVTVWQFEPWMSRSEYLWSIPVSDRIYRHVHSLVMGCIEGTYSDPTDGATHFLEPTIVRARRGGSLPGWAQGKGQRIGRHVFFKHAKPTI